MARVEIDVGPFPEAARSAVLDFREQGAQTYVRIGETTDRVSVWELPANAVLGIRARFRGASGRIGPAPDDDVRLDTKEKLADRPDPAELTMPAVVVKQDGPALEIVQDVPEGVARDEYAFEVVQTPFVASSAKDGLLVGYVAPGEPIAAHASPSDQQIWTRPVRLEDGALGDWSAAEVATVDPAVPPGVGHANDFAAGTIPTGVTGFNLGGTAALEVSGGDLRHKDLYAGDLGGYAGSIDVAAGDLGLRIPGVYTTALVTLGAAEAIQFQVELDLTSTTRPTFYAGSWLWPAGGPPRIEPDGTANDPRLLRDSINGGNDETPVEMDVYVATRSTVTGAAFSQGAFVPLKPGKVYPDVREYACQFRISTRFGKRVTIDNLNVWHCVWCLVRPWHSHSWAPELIYENVLGAAAASVTASVALATWDEVRVEIDWKNADASASQLFVRFNNDSGSNYYRQAAAAATSLLLGGGTLAAAAFETARFTIRNPAAGLERRVQIEPGQRSHATDSLAAPDPESAMWDNAADEITSIVVSATVGATPLASGTAIRIWGKRRI